MRGVATHPTPQRVLDAIQIITAWLREIDAEEALISRKGGASFHADRLFSEWETDAVEVERLRAENAKLRAQLDMFWRDA